MAKKSAGASEVNGFIAITNNKPKPTSKVAGAKKLDVPPSSKSKEEPKNAKPAKTLETKPTIKKTVSISKDVQKAETKSKMTNNVKTTPMKVTRRVDPAKSDAKVSPSSKSVAPNIKASLSGSRSSDKTSHSLTLSKPVNESLKVRVPISGASKAAPSTKLDKTYKTVGKPTQDSKPRSSNVKTVAKKPVSISSKTSNPQAKANVPEMRLKISGTTKSKPENLKAKPAVKSKEVLGKSGLSFNVTLEPAKVVKVKSVQSRIKAKDTEPTNISKAPSRPVANLTEAPFPPPLVKQRTFVKDDEDEELKSSLPHIEAADELEARQQAVSMASYEGDFEEYESDFEDDASEFSLSEATKVAPPQMAMKRTTLSPKPHEMNDEIVTALKQPVCTEESDASSPTTVVVSESEHANKEVVAESHIDNDYNYDDDFEDYSSDFEDDTESGFTSSNETSSDSMTTTSDTSDKKIESSKIGLKGKVIEEEKKLDSGNYDLKTTLMRSEAIRQTQLNDIKEAISRENTMFKDCQPVATSASPPPVHILDFKAAAAKSHDLVIKEQKRELNRGKVLLNMVKLHSMSYDLFEMQPLPYEDFIKLRGSANNIQRQTQTGDNDQSEEVQTEEVNMASKWTQWPASYHNWAGCDIDWGVYLEDKRGFGSEDVTTLNIKHFFPRHCNAKKLLNFATNASQLMTVILEEELGPQGFKNVLSLHKTDAHRNFSDGYVSIDCHEIDFLKDRKVTHVAFSPHFSNVILTCYDASGHSEGFPVEVTGRWLICLWDVIAVSQPIKVLIASASITSVAFDCLYSDLVYAGMSDGIIALWDLSEPDTDHEHSSSRDCKNVLRTPTFCSFSSQLDASDTHRTAVIGLRSVSCNDKRGEENIIIPTMLFSLSEDGVMITWTVLRTGNGSTRKQKIDTRMSPWGQVWMSLLSTHRPIDRVNKSLQCSLDFTCFEVKKDCSVLLGTNMGFVLQYPLNRMKSLVPDFGDTNVALMVSAIELCPLDSNYFLAGLSDGTVRLHSVKVKRPVKIFTASLPMTDGISSICWSSFRPDLIVVLDESSNLAIWNIRKNDVHPLIKMPFNGTPQSDDLLLKKVIRQSGLMAGEDMKKLVQNLFPTTCRMRGCHRSNMDLSEDIRLPYLAIVVQDKVVQVHRFNEQLTYNANNEPDVLQDYLARLSAHLT